MRDSEELNDMLVDALALEWRRLGHVNGNNKVAQ